MYVSTAVIHVRRAEPTPKRRVYGTYTSTNGQFPIELRCKLITLKALQRRYIILKSLSAHPAIRIGSRHTYLTARNNAVNIAI
jgi:hypothetical protein